MNKQRRDLPLRSFFPSSFPQRAINAKLFETIDGWRSHRRVDLVGLSAIYNTYPVLFCSRPIARSFRSHVLRHKLSEMMERIELN